MAAGVASLLEARRPCSCSHGHAMSGPASHRQRHAIRHSWMRWSSVGQFAFVGFVVGARTNLTLARSVRAEAATVRRSRRPAQCYRARWRLPQREEGLFRIENAAAQLRRPWFTRVAKVDDDSFVNVELLLAEVRRFSCVEHVLWKVACMGYNPDVFEGRRWPSKARPTRATTVKRGRFTFNYFNYGCWMNGFQPPTVPRGGDREALREASRQAIGTSRHVAAFSARASEAEEKGRQPELSSEGKVLKGTPGRRRLPWLLAQPAGAVANSGSGRIAYIHGDMHNLAWRRHGRFGAAQPAAECVVDRRARRQAARCASLPWRCSTTGVATIGGGAPGRAGGCRTTGWMIEHS